LNWLKEKNPNESAAIQCRSGLEIWLIDDYEVIDDGTAVLHVTPKTDEAHDD
jgi:hypothetical protein